MIPARTPHCALGALLVFNLIVGPAGHSAFGGETPPNRLTEAERQAGWQLLFDGQTTTGWRSFKKRDFPARGWVIADNCLKHQAQGGGGDIITDLAYDNFEFVFEWCLGPRANSGVKYLVSEDRGSALGHE